MENSCDLINHSRVDRTEQSYWQNLKKGAKSVRKNTRKSSVEYEVVCRSPVCRFAYTFRIFFFRNAFNREVRADISVNINLALNRKTRDTDKMNGGRRCRPKRRISPRSRIRPGRSEFFMRSRRWYITVRNPNAHRAADDHTAAASIDTSGPGRLWYLVRIVVLAY